MFFRSQCSSYTDYFASAVLFYESIDHVSIRVFNIHRPQERLLFSNQVKDVFLFISCFSNFSHCISKNLHSDVY